MEEKNEKNYVIIFTVSMLAVSILSGCGHEHTWIEATCTEPKTCSECGEIEGEKLGHSWVDATCTEPKTCSVCSETEGTALGHSWVDATCTEPKTCSVCGETEGTTLEHSWIDATCTEPKTCSVCGETVGNTADHELNSQGKCNICGQQIGFALNSSNYKQYLNITYEYYSSTAANGDELPAISVKVEPLVNATFGDVKVTYQYTTYLPAGRLLNGKHPDDEIVTHTFSVNETGYGNNAYHANFLYIKDFKFVSISGYVIE